MSMSRAAAVLTLAGALMVPALQAQPGPPGRRGPGMTGPRGGAPGQGIEVVLEHRDELGLSEAQVADLEALAEEARASREATVQRVRALRDEAAGDRAALREEMRALREEMRGVHQAHRARLEEVLSEEQLDRLRELRPHRRAGPRGGVGRPRPGGGRRGGTG